MVAIYREVLELDEVDIAGNFFDLGGHSLLATQLVSRLRRTSGRGVTGGAGARGLRIERVKRFDAEFVAEVGEAALRLDRHRRRPVGVVVDHDALAPVDERAEL